MRSHFVPQFYLRNFGDKIYLYDKTTEKVEESNPGDLAVKKNFYEPTSVIKSNLLETGMSKIEGRSSVVIQKIIKTRRYSNLSATEKSDFCSFVALQYLRTPERKTRGVQRSQKLLDDIVKAEGVTDWKIKYTEEGETMMHLDIMEGFDSIAAVLSQMEVMVLSNTTKIPLWTSDNPVNKYNMFGQFPQSNLGFISKGIEINIPLAPTVEIKFFDPVTYKKELVPEMFPMKEANVIHSNCLQTRQSTRFMFSSTKEFFMADTYMKEKTKIGNIDRTRIDIGTHELKREDFEDKEIYKKPECWIDPKIVEELRTVLDKKTQ